MELSGVAEAIDTGFADPEAGTLALCQED